MSDYPRRAVEEPAITVEDRPLALGDFFARKVDDDIEPHVVIAIHGKWVVLYDKTPERAKHPPRLVTENITNLRAHWSRIDPEIPSDVAPLSPLDRVCADRLADEVDVLVRTKVIDSRSPAADALLDYRNEPRSPRSDRLVDFERTHSLEPQFGSKLFEIVTRKKSRSFEPAFDHSVLVISALVERLGGQVTITKDEIVDAPTVAFESYMDIGAWWIGTTKSAKCPKCDGDDVKRTRSASLLRVIGYRCNLCGETWRAKELEPTVTITKAEADALEAVFSAFKSKHLSCDKTCSHWPLVQAVERARSQ